MPARPRPWLTTVVFAVTATTTALGLLGPAVQRALVRDPAFFDGQWWRLFSPILVNPEGWHQVVFNGVALLVVGSVAERVFGRVRWLALYLTGALAGEVYCYATGNYSAGTSVAVAGLFGGLLAWIVSGRAGLPAPPRIGAGALLAGAVVLFAVGDEHGAPILAGALVAIALVWFGPGPANDDLDGSRPR